MTDRDIMKQALEALKKYHYYTLDMGHPNHSMLHEGFNAVTALQERLAHCDRCGKRLGGECDIHTCTPKNQCGETCERAKLCATCAGVLVQPEQEPVAVWKLQEDGWDTICDGDWLQTLPVGTTLFHLPAAQPEQEPEYCCCPHDSDCAVHNMPAYPAGPCDCKYKDTHNLPPSDEVHEICLALINRALDKIEHENFGQMPNNSWTNKVLNVYHFFDSNPKAKKLTVIYTTAAPVQAAAST
jgi:hypothetical protein